jgi:conjugal transfer pilus assembly protein TraU
MKNNFYITMWIMMLSVTFEAQAKCQGKFPNPITDICWSCVFPITLGGMKITSGKDDTPNPHRLLCSCERPPSPVPVPGVPVSFWEPVRLVDVTRTPYCMVNLGGLKLAGDPNSYQGVGGVATNGGGSQRSLKHSFYQVHWYMYPIIYWLELLVDLACLEKPDPTDLVEEFQLTELDPFWDDDETSFIIHPEVVLFANLIAQAACAADCLAATSGFPLDQLFWCGGCQGSLYPFTGSISAHVGGVQASLLATQRMIAKLHREFLLKGYAGEAAMCGRYLAPTIIKSQYKTQMVYPIPVTNGCQPLGRSEILWGSGKEFSFKGEDFGYLIWRKRNCCLL